MSPHIDPLHAIVRPFAGVIFDCDGTLADTMPLHYRAWDAAMNARGAEFPEALFYEWGGVPTVRIVELLNERFGYSLNPQETADVKEAIYEALLPEALPVPRVCAQVREYEGRFPLAVASGGIRRLVVKTVEALGLLSSFQVICTAEDVEHGKPAPDLFLYAARQLGVGAKECLVFEDSDLGLEAARRAGMQAVDIRPWLGHP